MTPLDALLDRLAGVPVLVIGDLMLDHFVIGGVDRISPEAPVPVVRFEHESYRLGGAANVAHNVTSLGGRAGIVGVVGNDAEGARLLAGLDGLSIGTGGVVTDLGRCTTRKLRIVTTRNQQVARIDYESDVEIDGALEQLVIGRVRELSRHVRAILISDYLKGVVCRGVAAAAVEAAKLQGIPLLVDPKVAHVDYYAGASLVTPNHHEAESVTHMRIRTDEEASEAARRFRDRTRCEHVLITRGERGMWLLGPEGETALKAEAREVADVTGAGDTVIGTIALAMAAGASMLDAARLANRSAGIAVGKFGPAAVTAEEIKESLNVGL